jgi:hypothetical protein
MSQVMSRAALDAEVYSASEVLSVTVRCRVDSQYRCSDFRDAGTGDRSPRVLILGIVRVRDSFDETRAVRCWAIREASSDAPLDISQHDLDGCAMPCSWSQEVSPENACYA